MSRQRSNRVVVSPSTDVAARARNDALDGLRAIAAVSVFLYHLLVLAPMVADFDGPIEFEYYGRNLDIGVEIFFVLSGFLLARPFFAAWFAGEPGPSLRAFAIRRSLRIYPAWIAFLVIAVAWGDQFWFLEGTDYQPDDALRFVQWATLLHTWFYDPAHSSWTLSVEASFYVFLPLLTTVAFRVVRPKLRNALLVCAGVTAVGLFAEWYHVMFIDFGRFVPAALMNLGPGMALAALVAAPAMPRDVGPRTAAIAWVAAGVAFVAMSRFVSKSAYVVFGSLPPPGEQVTQAIWQAVVAVVVVGAVVRSTPGPVSRVAGLQPVAALGRISYSFYLWHLLVLYQFDWEGVSGPGAAWWMATQGFVITIAVSTVSYFAIERPAIGWARRLTAAPGSQSQPNSTNLPSR